MMEISLLRDLWKINLKFDKNFNVSFCYFKGKKEEIYYGFGVFDESLFCMERELKNFTSEKVFNDFIDGKVNKLVLDKYSGHYFEHKENSLIINLYSVDDSGFTGSSYTTRWNKNDMLEIKKFIDDN